MAKQNPNTQWQNPQVLNLVATGALQRMATATERIASILERIETEGLLRRKKSKHKVGKGKVTT
jgi:energy-coupling factor transporter ATP-binding protein EcfA2